MSRIRMAIWWWLYEVCYRMMQRADARYTRVVHQRMRRKARG